MLKLSSPQFAKLVESMRRIAATGGSDKRQTTRMEIQASVPVAIIVGQQVTQPFHALTRDVSIGGMGLLQRQPLNAGAPFLVALPYDRIELVLLCQAMYCQQLADGIYGIGARYNRLADAPLVEQLRIARASAATTARP